MKTSIPPLNTQVGSTLSPKLVQKKAEHALAETQQTAEKDKVSLSVQGYQQAYAAESAGTGVAQLPEEMRELMEKMQELQQQINELLNQINQVMSNGALTADEKAQQLLPLQTQLSQLQTQQGQLLAQLMQMLSELDNAS